MSRDFSDELPTRTLENVKPTTPTNLTIGNTTSTSIELSWEASTDNYQLAGYNIYINGELYQTIEDLTIILTGLTESETYTINLSAINAD